MHEVRFIGEEINAICEFRDTNYRRRRRVVVPNGARAGGNTLTRLPRDAAVRKAITLESS